MKKPVFYTVTVLTITVICLVGCTGKNPVVSDVYKSDSEKFEALFNTSLISSTDLNKFVDKGHDVDIVLEMILDNNIENDTSKLSTNNDKIMKNEELKKRLLILSHNMR